MFSAKDDQSREATRANHYILPDTIFSQPVVSFISHEVGNPVSSLKGFLDIVLDGRVGPLTPLQTEFLGLAKLSANRLCRMVEDFGDLGLLARGIFGLETEGTRLEAVVERAVGQLRPLATSRQIPLENLFPGNVPMCYIDSKRIGRVITNIVAFALQFTPAKDRVVITGEAMESKVLLFVTGMESSHLPVEYSEVFSGDRRERESDYRPDATWLGLMVARQVIEHHQGEVWLDRQLGGVARICLSLPIGECPPAAS